VARRIPVPGSKPMHPPAVSVQATTEAASLGADAERLRILVADAAEVRRDDRLRLRWALVYPALVATLAILGTAWVTARDGPLIHNVEDAFRDPPIPTPRSAWPQVGAAGVGVAATGVLAAAGLAAWLVALVRRDARAGSLAVRCDVLAELAGSDCPGDVGDRLARAIVVDVDPHDGSLPPLVAHAVARDDVDGRARLLRSTAAFYRGLAERRRRAVRRFVPTAACCVAGLAVLLYGLALFRPMAGLVDTLAVPHDAVAAGQQVEGGP